MKELYIECNMGVSGDMLNGALLDTLNEKEKNEIITKLNSLLDGVKVKTKEDIKCGISGTKFDVIIKEQGHHHSSINEIFSIIDNFDLSENVKDNAKAIYEIIAKAESKVHNTNVTDVHLHEVGAKDAIIDIVSCCYIIDYLGIEKIVSSPIATGYGEVKSAHGILPIPAPATAEILKGMDNYSSDIKGELTTPTGAAIIKYFANEISKNNTLVANSIGYGMGTKDFEKSNCIRVFIGESNKETVFELRCQIDDMTGEDMGYAINKLMSLGALDAFVTPIIMKKNRPAFLFTVISKPENAEYLTSQIFKHTTTLGIRKVECQRDTLNREIIEKNDVHIKRAKGFGTENEKIEFDDLAKIADERDISIFEARKAIQNEK